MLKVNLRSFFTLLTLPIKLFHRKSCSRNVSAKNQSPTRLTLPLSSFIVKANARTPTNQRGTSTAYPEPDEAMCKRLLRARNAAGA